LVYDLKQNSQHMSRRYEKKELEEKELVEHIKIIEKRLSGIATKYNGSSVIPLSTEGHINYIIQEATSLDNLTVMFKGWMPWM